MILEYAFSMTSPVLRVTSVSLRELAQRCGALADGIAPALPAVSTSAWLRCQMFTLFKHPTGA